MRILVTRRWPADGPTVTLVPSGLVLPSGARDTGSGDSGATVSRVRLVAE